MNRVGLAVCFLHRVIGVCAAICLGAVADAGPLLANGPDFHGQQVLDVPAPLMTEHSPTESDRDHLEAVSLFAAGRMHERREEFAAALRCYQRALRYDPRAGAIVRAIIPVAARLKRYPEAARYAMMATEVDDSDPLLLRRLGVYLTDEGDLAGAAVLYEKALAARGRGKENAADILVRMELGRIYHLAEKYKPAAENFAKVTYALDHPDEFKIDDQVQKILLSEPGPTYVLFGDCFLEADRSDEALAAFQKADALDANPSLLQLNLARVYAKTGKPVEALGALDACFAAHLVGQGSVPYETLADVLKQLGKSEELIPRLEKLLAESAENIPLTYFLASQYRAAGQLEKAESLYLELLKRAATPTVYRSLIDLYRQSKRYDALLKTFGQAIDETGVLDAMQAEGQAISGDVELMRGIVEAARTACKTAPDQFSSSMAQAVAILALEAKQFDAAGEFFELALAAKPKQSAELLLAWGTALLMDNHAAEAIKVFQRGIDEKALPGDNPAFHFYLAGAFAMNEQIDEALAIARQAAEIKKNSARMSERVAWVLYFAKRYSEAKQAYEELIRVFDAEDRSPETRAVLRQARLILSNIGVLENRLPDAEEWLEQVLDEFPDDAGALNDLGYLWADQNKNLARARQMIEKAVADEPDNAAYRDSLGWVLLRLGCYPEAVAELEKASAGKKVDGVVLDHLGDAYQKANQPDKAIDAWRRAAEALRGDKELDKAEAVEKKLTK